MSLRSVPGHYRDDPCRTRPCCCRIGPCQRARSPDDPYHPRVCHSNDGRHRHASTGLSDPGVPAPLVPCCHRCGHGRGPCHVPYRCPVLRCEPDIHRVHGHVQRPGRSHGADRRQSCRRIHDRTHDQPGARHHRAVRHLLAATPWHDPTSGRPVAATPVWRQKLRNCDGPHLSSPAILRGAACRQAVDLLCAPDPAAGRYLAYQRADSQGRPARGAPHPDLRGPLGSRSRWSLHDPKEFIAKPSVPGPPAHSSVKP